MHRCASHTSPFFWSNEAQSPRSPAILRTTSAAQSPAPEQVGVACARAHANPKAPPTKSIDLNQLAGRDLPAAELGFLLNQASRGGVNLDNNSQVLTFSEFEAARVKLAPRLNHPDDLAALARLGWPQIVQTPTGLVAAWRDGQGGVRLAKSTDGKSFTALTPPPTVGAMVNISMSKAGQYALTYQQDGAGGGMTSVVQRSNDGKTWTPAVPLTANSTNVHDTARIARADGGFDAYFISATGPEGFSLYRRHLREDGGMGPEQRLTDAAKTGEASKPNLVRLPDGKVQLMYAGITARDPATGEPTRQQLFSAILAGDAPL